MFVIVCITLHIYIYVCNMISRREMTRVYGKGNVLKRADMLKVFQGSSKDPYYYGKNSRVYSESFGCKFKIIVISTTSNWNDVLNSTFIFEKSVA